MTKVYPYKNYQAHYESLDYPHTRDRSTQKFSFIQNLKRTEHTIIGGLRFKAASQETLNNFELQARIIAMASILYDQNYRESKGLPTSEKSETKKIKNDLKKLLEDNQIIYVFLDQHHKPNYSDS